RTDLPWVWGERKFVQTVVRIGMLLQGTHGKAPANIIDEVINEALTARDKIINQNIGSTTNQQISSPLSFRSRKDLRQNFPNPHGTVFISSISIINQAFISLL